MAEILRYSSDDVRPDKAAVFESQGVPVEGQAREEIEALYTSAMNLLTQVGTPVGIWSEVSSADFGNVYQGEGINEMRTPVSDIYPEATDLGLFCVTLGPKIGDEIQRRFSTNDFAVASMLDSVASTAADKVAELVERHFRELLNKSGRLASDAALLRYSPGYCGWHISGQGRLFDFLEPDQIGVSLSETFLMQPLKSVSGVLIAGPATIHDFPNTYPFCSYCETRGCRNRIRSLLTQ